MTFIIGLLLPSSGFLATDTGSYSAHGESLGTVTGKLRQLPGGWAAASGNWGWAQLAFEAIERVNAKNVSAQAAAIGSLHESDAYLRLAADVDAADGAQLAAWRASADHPTGVTTATGALGRVVTVYRSAAGYRGSIITDDGALTPIPTGKPFVAPPPGLTLADVGTYLRTAGPPSGGYAATSRYAAALVRWAAGRSPLMSTTLELVYLTPGGDRHLAPTPAAELLSRSAAHA